MRGALGILLAAAAVAAPGWAQPFDLAGTWYVLVHYKDDAAGNPVEINTGRARVQADSIEVTENGKVIIFEKRVRMTILPFNSEGDKAGMTNGPETVKDSTNANGNN